MTEKSKPSGTDREAGAQIETPAQEKTFEVLSRVAHGKFHWNGSVSRISPTLAGQPIA
ncbi:MAG: hypothetical protein JEZ00_08615 [Anaerolineaceae bacterium]|nr:hypothetical protein [Anaerolineaceae bacterium]